MTTTKIYTACKEASQWRESSYAHMTRAKRAGELLHTDVVGSINLIDYNGARFIVYGINNVFRMHFKDCTKEKEEISRAFCV